jgi:hypothetical protein
MYAVWNRIWNNAIIIWTFSKLVFDLDHRHLKRQKAANGCLLIYNIYRHAKQLQFQKYLLQ